MKENVLGAIREHGMLQKGDTVIEALSGGADSLALFHLLYGLQEELGIRLMAAHFEHGLRGEESHNDAAFVQAFCAGWGVELYMEHGRMAQTKKPAGEGTEAWARRLRYAFFEKLAAEHGAKIATAHTQSDNAETVLFNMARGSGPRGLAGIPPVRGPFIRPLLGVSRAQVEAYCAAHGLAYVTDSTNADEAYARNLLRHSVMPLLRRVNPGAEDALGRMAADMRELDAYLEQQAQNLLAEAKSGNSISLGYETATLAAAPRPVLLKAMALLAPHGASRAALGRMLQLVKGQMPAVQLEANVVARVKKRCLFIETNFPTVSHPREVALAEGEIPLWGPYAVKVRLLHSPPGQGFFEEKQKKGLTFVADYGKILNGVFRARCPQDTYRPAGRGLTKQLRKWMNEQAVPAKDRDALPLLAQGSSVLWVWGAGFCDGLQPERDTKQWLVIQQIISEKDGAGHAGYV